jgi:hypothetical protein
MLRWLLEKIFLYGEEQEEVEEASAPEDISDSEDEEILEFFCLGVLYGVGQQLIVDYEHYSGAPA